MRNMSWEEEYEWDMRVVEEELTILIHATRSILFFMLNIEPEIIAWKIFDKIFIILL